MFNLEELVLLSAAIDPEGLIQSRQREEERGWKHVFDGLVMGGYLKPILENIPEPGADGYTLSTFLITSEGRRVASILKRRSRRIDEDSE
jgi:hypothetical protein